MCLDNKDCHTNLSFSSEQIVIQNIQKKILEKRGKLNYQNIKYELILIVTKKNLNYFGKIFK